MRVWAIFLGCLVTQTLDLAEGICIAIHCMGFVAFMMVLWLFGPNASASKTFLYFEDLNGWNNYGVATLIGVIGPISTFIGGKPPYEPLKDFAPVTLVARSSFLVVAGPKRPVASIADLIALAKRQAGQVTYASSGESE